VSKERRQHPRVAPEHPLYARAEGIDADLKMLDVSVGGFLIQGPVAFRPHETYYFWISAAIGGRVFELHARAVYCRPRSGSATPTYETGFAFLDLPHTATEATVLALIDAVTLVPQVG
jgi:PilZ domain-containing protein